VEVSLEDQESLPYRLYIEELERQKGVTLALQEQVSYQQIYVQYHLKQVVTACHSSRNHLSAT
jgi:hypothetical protein